jgi:hypothetical protein
MTKRRCVLCRREIRKKKYQRRRLCRLCSIVSLLADPRAPHRSRVGSPERRAPKEPPCEPPSQGRSQRATQRASGCPSPSFFKSRIVLTPRNKDIHKINSHIMRMLPGELQTFTSADTHVYEPGSEQERLNLTVEFLHNLDASGLPIANLSLKVGCPIVILRNIDPNRGLCNGTRATVVRMSTHVLEVRLIGGEHDGQHAMIPRIPLTPSVQDWRVRPALSRARRLRFISPSPCLCLIRLSIALCEIKLRNRSSSSLSLARRREIASFPDDLMERLKVELLGGDIGMAREGGKRSNILFDNCRRNSDGCAANSRETETH